MRLLFVVLMFLFSRIVLFLSPVLPYSSVGLLLLVFYGRLYGFIISITSIVPTIIVIVEFIKLENTDVGTESIT